MCNCFSKKGFNYKGGSFGEIKFYIYLFCLVLLGVFGFLICWVFYGGFEVVKRLVKKGFVFLKLFFVN